MGKRRGELLPWERQLGEPSDSFEFFCAYRDLAPSERSFKAVGSMFGRTAGTIADRAKKWQWSERTAAYDEHLAMLMAENQQKALAKQAEKWAARQLELRDEEWKLHSKLRDKVERMLEFPLASQRTSKDGKTIEIQPSKWFMGDVPKMALAASQLARLSAEMETSRQKVDTEVNKELDGILQTLEQSLTPDEFRKVIGALADKLGVKDSKPGEPVSSEDDT